MTKIKPASLIEVKAFFEEKDTKKFTEEWKMLSVDEKQWFKDEVGAIINS